MYTKAVAVVFSTDDTQTYVFFGIAGFFVLCWLISLVSRLAKSAVDPNELAAMSPMEQCRHVDQKKDGFLTTAYGRVNPILLCPHCQERGLVRTKRQTKKAGVSGTKAAGAILTGGVSILATGLSRKQTVTSARCGYCKSVWDF